MDEFISHRLIMDDGVAITAYERPGRDSALPPVVLSNGLGGDLQTWTRIIEGFPREQRLVSWDYRGLYASSLQGAQRDTVRLDVAMHATDCVAILEHLGIDKALFVGWSMGVQLNWEVYRREADRFLGIVAISGGFGGLLSVTMGGAKAEPLLRPGFTLFGQVATHLGPTIARHTDAFMRGAQFARLLHPDVDPVIFSRLMKVYVQLDFDIYIRILHGLGEHDVTGVLPQVTCPALVVVGSRDPITPPSVSREMDRALQRSELLVIPKGTHYLPMEFPDILNARIQQFTSQIAGYHRPPLRAV